MASSSERRGRLSHLSVVEIALLAALLGGILSTASG
jgi:hypothetical protein